MKIFLFPLFIAFFLNPKILGFLFITKNNQTWGADDDRILSHDASRFMLYYHHVPDWGVKCEKSSTPENRWEFVG